MRVWLIMWEWVGEHAKVENKCVDIISRRLEIDSVKAHVLRLHNFLECSLAERAAMARYNDPQEPAYEPQVHWPKDRSNGPEIHCGHNPFLVARLVKNLTVLRDAKTGKELVNWEPVGTSDD
jgi:hypothetical protein